MTETNSSKTAQNDDTRTGLTVASIKQSILDHLLYTQGTIPEVATKLDFYLALARTVRDRLQHNWINSAKNSIEEKTRVVIYLSAEFLIGPQLHKNLINLDIYQQVNQALEELGIDLEGLIAQEVEPGLGNGGLGRLAACYMDSLATLEVPSMGYGIRYEFGIFEQQIQDGWQVEKSDIWLHHGNPWEIMYPTYSPEVGFEGSTHAYCDIQGFERSHWTPGYIVKGVPYMTPIVGYRVNSARTLRLWRAEASESFDFQDFNRGDYYGAVDEKVQSENLTKVLYPNDEAVQGKALRLKQQYFLVSCTLQELTLMLTTVGQSLEQFHEKFAIQLNDTHPALAIVELMRLLLDVHAIEWDKAWEITRNTFSYTNHTLLPEALETWPVPMFGKRLPRHLEIIYEINARFLDQVRQRWPGDSDRVARMSLIDEKGERHIRMAHLACIGSQKINGVAQLHSDLLKNNILHDFYQMMPEKFINVTNGVTPRRFLRLCNPKLSDLITAHIGDSWITNLTELRRLEVFADDAEFQQQWREIKQANKSTLAQHLRQHTGVTIDPNSLFDIQVKRIHEYKRQLLNVLHIVTLYNRLQKNPGMDFTHRTVIFGGKAAPGYYMAKLIIKLINCVADVVNNDAAVADRLKVVFFPNYNVKNSHYIYPAADLSEQISTAGKEASGTGNMKFSLNGALTIGTLDGANIEIREEVGEENFFLFGLDTEQVQQLKTDGYSPQSYYQSNAELKQAIDMINRGFFSPAGHTDLFMPLIGSLLHHDEYMLMADYQSYLECQQRVSQVYQDSQQWTKTAILNVARMGKFSSDRAIREYCSKIWHIEPENISANISNA